MLLPNFFLIGAPKCGTTALYNSLKQHPDIYMSPVKEPCFFAFLGEPPVSEGPAGNFFRRAAVWRPRDYLLLFANVKKQRAIGEASTIYLRSALAARRIKENLPQSRLIAILRQPAERAYSGYSFMRQHKMEPASKFVDAMEREESRIKKGWFSGLYYMANGYYYAQLSAYYDLFPSQQIKVYLYEDWKDSPQAMLRDLFHFLDIDEDFKPEIIRKNVTLIPRSSWFHRLATSPRLEERLDPTLPKTGRRTIVGTLRKIDTRLNLTSPPLLDTEIHASLTAKYREDILKLQDLIKRDLSHWFVPK